MSDNVLMMMMMIVKVAAKEKAELRVGSAGWKQWGEQSEREIPGRASSRGQSRK